MPFEPQIPAGAQEPEVEAPAFPIHDVTSVSFEGGAFVEVGENRWEERSGPYPTEYVEEGRSGSQIRLVQVGPEAAATTASEQYSTRGFEPGDIVTMPTPDPASYRAVIDVATMNARVALATVRSGEVIHSSDYPITAINRVDAWVMHNVVLADGSGAFAKVGRIGTSWELRARNRDLVRYRETGRDRWSVYLKKVTPASAAGDPRNTWPSDVALDLYQRQAKRGRSGGGWTGWKSIGEINELNGFTVNEVELGGVSLRRNSDATWRLKMPGHWMELREDFRDKWSVYLVGGGLKIQIDLYLDSLRDWRDGSLTDAEGILDRLEEIAAEPCRAWNPNGQYETYNNSDKQFGGRAYYGLFVGCQQGQARVAAEAGAYVNVFSREFRAATVEVEALNRRGFVRVDGPFSVLVNRQIHGSLTAAWPIYGVRYQKEYILDLGITEAGIDVEVGAGIIAGVDDIHPIVRNSGGVTEVGLGGEPFVSASGYAAAAVDLEVVEFWARGGIDLVRAGLPSTLVASVNAAGKVDGLDASASFQFDLLANGYLGAGATIYYLVGSSDVTFFDVDLGSAYSLTVPIF